MEATKKSSMLKAMMLCVLLTAATGHANDRSPGGQHSETNTDVIEHWSDRALSHMQGWITRARNKITGREDDAMQGCGEMMNEAQMMSSMPMMQDGSGMMGGMHGAKPNTQWRDAKP